MSFSLPQERHFSASAFTALIRLRRYIADHDVEPGEAAASLNSFDSTFAASDVEAAFSLHETLPQHIAFSVFDDGLRRSLSHLISIHRPWWRKLAPAGRAHLREALSDTERQLFADAKLLDEMLSPAALTWWYELQAAVRGENETTQSIQGGMAEIWTLEFERKRLKALGIELAPEWTGFENTKAGYDVKSYDVGPAGPIARLIEVKSSVSEPPRMIVTRNEWESAIEFGSAYRFYLWQDAEAGPDELTVSDVAAHIPADQGYGSWMKVEITFPSS